MMRLRCGRCGAVLTVPESAIGKRIQCSKCQSVFRVPAPRRAEPQGGAAELVDVVCPACGTRLKLRARDAVVGRMATCAQCRKAFEVTESCLRVEASRPSADGSAHAPAAAVSAAPGAPAVAAAPAPLPAPDAPPPDDDSADEDVPYPWAIPAELQEKAETYDAAQDYRPFTVKVNECLNSLLKSETFKGLVKAELRVYPDLVGITERPPGCLANLVMRLPGPIQTLIYWTLGGGLLGLLFAPLVILIGLTALPFLLVWDFLMGLRLRQVARKILADPHSSYAIRKLYQYTALGPRYWAKGDIVQLVRLDTHRMLLKRSLLLFVQDAPLPDRRGCLQTGALLLISRMFQGTRRLYVVDVEGGPDAADAAATAAAQVLAVPVVRARFSFGNLAQEQA